MSEEKYSVKDTIIGFFVYCGQARFLFMAFIWQFTSVISTAFFPSLFSFTLVWVLSALVLFFGLCWFAVDIEYGGP